MTEATPVQSLEYSKTKLITFFSDSWRGLFQRKQVFGNSPKIFFRAHFQVNGLSIVTNSWIGLGIRPKQVKFVSIWLETIEKKTIFFVNKK